MVSDPIQGLIDYVNDIKPYHTKIVETAVGYVHNEDVNVTLSDVLELDVELIIPSLTVGSPPVPLQICAKGFGAFWDRPSPYVVVGLNTSGAFPNSTIVIKGDHSAVFNSGTVFEVRVPGGSPLIGALTYTTSTGNYDNNNDTTVITITGALTGAEFFFTVVPPDQSSGDVFIIYDVTSTTALGNMIVVTTDNAEEFLYGRGIEIRNATNPALNKSYNILASEVLTATTLQIITTGGVLADSTLDGDLVFSSDGWDGLDLCSDIPTGLNQFFMDDELVQQWQFIGSPATNIGSPQTAGTYPGGVDEPAGSPVFTENAFQYFIVGVGSPVSMNKFVIEGDITLPSMFEVTNAVTPPYNPYAPTLGSNNHVYSLGSPSPLYDPLTNRLTVTVGSPGIIDPYPTGYIVPV